MGIQVSIITQTANFTELTNMRSWGKNIQHPVCLNSRLKIKSTAPRLKTCSLILCLTIASFSLNYRFDLRCGMLGGTRSNLGVWLNFGRCLEFILPSILCIIFGTTSKNAPTAKKKKKKSLLDPDTKFDPLPYLFFFLIQNSSKLVLVFLLTKN